MCVGHGLHFPFIASQYVSSLVRSLFIYFVILVSSISQVTSCFAQFGPRNLMLNSGNDLTYFFPNSKFTPLCWCLFFFNPPQVVRALVCLSHSTRKGSQSTRSNIRFSNKWPKEIFIVLQRLHLNQATFR